MAHIQILDEGTEKQRFKVHYEVKSVSGDRKRRSRTFPIGTSKREVNRFKNQVELDYEKSEGLDYSKITLSEFLDMYIELYTGSLAITTRNNYIQMINAKEHGLRACLGSVRLEDLSTLKIQNYVRQLEKDGLSPKSIRNHVRLLGSVLKCAMIHNYIDKSYNPVSYVVLPKKSHDERQIYTVEELQQFLKLVDQEDNDYLKLEIYLGLFAGLRRSELSALRIEDIDLKKRRIRIENARVYGGKGKGSVLKETKTSASVRNITICNTLYPVLKKAVRQYERNKIQYDDFEDSGFLFSDEHGKAYSTCSITGRYQRFRKRIEPEMRTLNFHMLRHCFASMLIISGADVKSVQESLGHSSLDMTLRIYSQSTEDKRRECVMNLDKIFDEQ